MGRPIGAERQRLLEDARRDANWQRWGPYLAERQWGTVREDYSATGDCWNYLPHEHARSRAYRWGEDGLLGFTDRECRLCFSFALWNGRDPILKERLFGLTGPEGNHGEDVKEEYFYLDAVPTSAWWRTLYKYPQVEFPYARLRDENRRRGRAEREFELADAGAFAEDRFFDVQATFAKSSPDDVLIELVVHNRGPAPAPLHVLPQLWFRNTWSWGRQGEGYWPRGAIEALAAPDGERRVVARGADLPPFELVLEEPAAGALRGLLATENETNTRRLFGTGEKAFAKDAFHDAVVHGDAGAVDPRLRGSKLAFHCEFTVPAGGEVRLRLRLRPLALHHEPAFGAPFDEVLAQRAADAQEFYDEVLTHVPDAEGRSIARQAYAGLLTSRQFYHYDVRTWLAGDPAQPPPPPERRRGRNSDFQHLYNRDVLSMPDKWEYPWFAAWDLAFHMIPYARLDPEFAKRQLLLLMREWYMAPSGQIPAYEFAFDDVNPPVHAWACWRVYKMTGPRGRRDRAFLARAFHKLLLNFTWWVNRKDVSGKHVFGGGFLGLDNIGVFDRSQPLPTGGILEQADGTAWMAFYCATMLSMALELAAEDDTYEDVASKFFEHFVAITHAMNTLGGTGLWDEQDGFYYDQITFEQRVERLRIRSLVGLVPLCAVEILPQSTIDKLPGFARRMRWFMANEKELAGRVTFTLGAEPMALLAVPSKEQLLRVLTRVLDETEFLSPHGIRSLSAVHRDQPFVLRVGADEHRVDYAPAESTTTMFGGNSNWRGPVWFPVNYLLIEAIERYGRFYGEELRVECPRGSGRMATLQQVADELRQRLAALFRPRADGSLPFAGEDRRFADHPHWRGLYWFHEYFDGDTGRGCGAAHQTGWTALVTQCFADGA
ncbi:MAG: glucosidase [Planctomycetes bacterium]|nr:glucosidase [Planctomycetota bacterium]